MKPASPSSIDELYGLEPVLDLESGAGSDSLEDFVEIGCPYCGEAITVRVDVAAGDQSYIEDCQVCCQPITLSIHLTAQGQLGEVRAERGDS